MNNDRVSITTPVGRIVGGSVSEWQKTDADGKPLVVKNGPDAGKPTQRLYIAFAIKKTQPHWANETWGRPIWDLGHRSFPGGQAQRPDFAWKITDGDSQVPNKKGRKPCDNEGYPGNWVLNLQTYQPVKTVNSNGTQAVDPKTIKPGHYVQILLNVASNDDANRNPGVYLNPDAVAWQAFGPEISFGPDTTAVGFGQNIQLPPDASPTPVGGVSATGAAPPAQAPAPTPTPPPANVAQPAPAPAPVAVAPNPAILPSDSVVVPPPPPGGTVAAPPFRRPVMTPAAGSTTYERYKGAGWTDDQLIAASLMTWG
jgi:hypothetical protein